MTTSSLPVGIHSYGDIVARVKWGVYSFQTVSTLGGRSVPLLGISSPQYDTIKTLASELGLRAILFGSRVAGPRTVQRTLHPALARRTRFLESGGRHASIGLPAVSNVHIRKDAIKELGIDNPLTSDLSIAVVSARDDAERDLRMRATEFEQRLNRDLGVPFPIRVFVEIFGCVFESIPGFLAFGRDRFIKGELPADHGYSDEEIEAAFSMLLHLVPP